RDAVLENLNTDMADINDRNAAVAYIGSHLGDIEQAAGAEIVRQGCHYPVQAAIGEQYYGWRTNGGVVFSPGRYTSLTVTIGQGGGHNWWGVLYPPFCLVSENNDHSGVEVRCKLWDLACGLKEKIVEK
ncbi:MAG: stage II sporulation protein R, partial [Methylocystaceae bacterium]